MAEELKNSTVRLLRWSERYTKTDMVYLAQGGFWSVVGQVVSSLSVLAMSVMLARYLSQDDYGQYKYVLSLVALLSTFSLTGLSNAVFQSAARGFDAALPEGFRTGLRWSILVFAGALAVGGYYLMHGNVLLGLGVLVGGCLSPVIAGANLYSSFLAGKREFGTQTIYVALGVTIIPAAATIGASMLTGDPLAVIVAFFLSNAAAGFYFYTRTVRAYHSLDAKRDPHMLSYSKHLSLMGIISGIAGNIDNILVFQLIGAPALAVYTFATGIIDQAKGPLKSLDTMTQARFIGRSNHEIARGMGSKMLWLFALSIAFIAAYIPLAPYIYQILFPAYLNAVPYSQVYALSMLYLILTPASSYINAKRRVKAQYVSGVVSALLQITLMVAGIMLWGLMGLIIARVLTRFSSYAVLFLFYRSAVQEPGR